MGFREFATSETSALVERLASASKAEIEAATVRIQAAADAALGKLRAEVDQLRAALDKARSEATQFKPALDKARSDTEQYRAALEKARTDQKALQASLDRTRTEEKTREATLKSLQAELQKQQERVKGVEAQLAQAVSAKAQAETEFRKAQNAAAQLVSQRGAVEKELEQTRQLVAGARGERDAAAEELRRAEALWVEQSRAVREQVLKIAAAPLEQLRTAFHRLAAADTVNDALTVLIEALTAEFSRVALFNVNGNRLEGRQQTGFDFDSDISKVVVPLTKGSALAEAVRSRKVQGLTASDLTDSSRKLFGGSPTFVLILPVPIDGEVQAVLYADNSDRVQPQFSTPRRAVQVAEILLWHAVPLLDRLSEDEKAVAELRDYATQLLGELEAVYDGDAAAGQGGDKLRRRLEPNLEYARKMFNQRAEMSGLAVADLFEQQLAAFIRDRKKSHFARDLAAVSGVDLTLAAEAS
jgi:predicted  nucleic acid-binding Zn-ribbon protein